MRLLIILSGLLACDWWDVPSCDSEPRDMMNPHSKILRSLKVPTWKRVLATNVLRSTSFSSSAPTTTRPSLRPSSLATGQTQHAILDPGTGQLLHGAAACVQMGAGHTYWSLIQSLKTCIRLKQILSMVPLDIVWVHIINC